MDVGIYKSIMKTLHGDAPARHRESVARDKVRRQEEAARKEAMVTGPRKQATHREMVDASLACMSLGLQTYMHGWEARATTPEQIQAVARYQAACAAWNECPPKD